jgi:hypothetical protein
MWPHFVNLLSYSWNGVLVALSTSTLAVVLFSLAAPVATFLVTITVVSRRNPGRTFTRHLKESALPTAVGFLVPLLLLGIVFGWQVVRAVYGDHQSLVNKIKSRELKSELGGSLDGCTWAPVGSRRQDVFVTTWGTITNPHGPQTALMRFSMKLVFRDGRTVQGVIPAFNFQDFHLSLGSDPHKEVLLRTPLYWPTSAGAPIPAGGKAEGWLYAFFNNVDTATIDKDSPELVMEFTDVASGQIHSLERELVYVPDYSPETLGTARKR